MLMRVCLEGVNKGANLEPNIYPICDVYSPSDNLLYCIDGLMQERRNSIVNVRTGVTSFLHQPIGMNKCVTDPRFLVTTWWRHQMETLSALLAICPGNSPVPGEFPAQRPVTRSFDVFFDLRLNKRLRKQSWGWCFETLSCPLWRRCNDNQCAMRNGWIGIVSCRRQICCEVERWILLVLCSKMYILHRIFQTLFSELYFVKLPSNLWYKLEIYKLHIPCTSSIHSYTNVMLFLTWLVECDVFLLYILKRNC